MQVLHEHNHAASHLLAKELCNRRAICRVKGGVDLIKQVKWCWIAALDGKDKGERHQRLLTTTELLHEHRFVGCK